MPRIEEPDVFGEIEQIPTQKLASDLPDEFIGKIVNVVRDVKKGNFAGSPILKITMMVEEDEVITSYRIPKSWTGRGQLDLLRTRVEAMGLSLRDLEGKTFLWKRVPLEGTMKGNTRHYPLQLIE